MAFEITSSPVPAPTSGRFSREAADLARAFTWSGVRFGRPWSRSAIAPETTAAVCDVPLPLTRLVATRASGLTSFGVVVPSLPPAITTTIPAFHACSTAKASGPVR